MNPMSGSSPDNPIIPKEKTPYTVSPTTRVWLSPGNPEEKMRIVLNPISYGDLGSIRLLIWSDDQANEVLQCWRDQSKLPPTKGIIQSRDGKLNIYEGGNAQSKNPWLGMIENNSSLPFVFSIHVEKM